MARTWTLEATLAVNVASVGTTRALVLGGAVYFYAGPNAVTSYPAIFKWDGATLTALTNFSSLPLDIDTISASYKDICIFDGEVFIGYGNGNSTSKDRIYKWDGGTTWSLDYELEDETVGFPYLHFVAGPTASEGLTFPMDTDGSYMFIAAKQGVGAGQTGCRIVARNTSGAYTVATMPGGGYESPTPQLVGLSKGSRYGSVVGNNRVGADTYRAIQGGSPNFSDISGANIGDKRLIGYADGKSFWSVVDGSNWELKYSTTWGVSLTAAGNLERTSSNRSGFVFKDCAEDAIMLSLLTDQAYTWDPATDTFVADGSTGTGLPIRDYFVLNGTLFLLSDSATANSIDIWNGGPVAAPAFYYGRGSLRNRAALPFTFLNIGGLAVSHPFAVLGSGIAGAQMVAYAGPANDYGSFTNFTGALSTANPIVAFDSSPYGDSAGAEGSGEDSGPGGHLDGGKC